MPATESSPPVKVTVLIPAYNEAATLVALLERVNAQSVDGVEFEVLVVDDGSSDATPQLLADNPHLYTRAIRLPVNGGKGAAVRAGLSAASGEFVLFQDADLEYDPDDYAKLMSPVLLHNADIVMGSRLIAPQYTRVHYFWNKLGNRSITLLFNILNNTTFTDIYSCYLLFRRKLVEPSRLKANGWGQQAELLSMAVAHARVIYEVPISYHGRTYDEGKKIRAHHVLDVFANIIRGRLRR